MQSTTRLRVYQLDLVVLHALVVLSILGLALVGQMPAEAAGWLIRPVAAGGQAGRRPTAWLCVWRPRWPGSQSAALGQYLAVSWPPVLLRSLAVWALSGGWGPAWLRLVPWVLWLWQSAGVGGPAYGNRRSGCGASRIGPTY